MDELEDKERILDNLKTMKGNLSDSSSMFKYFPKNYLYWLEQGIKLIEELCYNKNEKENGKT